MYDKRFHHRIEIVPRAAEVYLGEDNHWHIDYFGPDVPCDHEVDTQWNREQAVGIACAFVNGKPRPEFCTPPVIEGATPRRTKNKSLVPCYKDRMTLDETLREIKAAMDKQDRTIRSVALAIGKHEQEVGQWFKGEHRPSFASLSALAAVVGLEIVLRKTK